MPKNKKASDDDAQPEGLEASMAKLESIVNDLESGEFGLEEVNPEGQAFDPELHEAMAQQPDGTVDPNTVIQVFQKGYRLRDRLLRPALVSVAGPAEK